MIDAFYGRVVATGSKMALKLDTTISSMNGSNNDSNDGDTDGMLFKISSDHSSSSNCSGFHSDRLQLHQQSRQSQRTMSRNRVNIKHKPTYVSVFASDPDCSSPLFDEFNRRFATNRPNFLNGTLCPPTGDEEMHSTPSVTAPLITPSRQSISPSSFTNTTSQSPDPMTHSETSKETYRNRCQPLIACSPGAVEQELSHSTVHREGAVRQELQDTTTSYTIPSSNGIFNSNQSVQEIMAHKSYKCARLKSEMEEDAARISECKDEKSEVSMEESLSEFQEDSSAVFNYRRYPRVAAESEEFCITLSTSTDLPATKLPHDDWSQSNEGVKMLHINKQHENGKSCDHMKQSSAYEICNLLSDSITNPSPKSTPPESGRAAPHQSFMRSQERTMSEFVTSKTVPRNGHESHGSTDLEEPPLQILSRSPEFEVTSEGKQENRPMKTNISHHDLNLVENPTLKSKDTSKVETYSADMRKSRFASSVSATKLNDIVNHVVPQRPDALRNDKSTSIVFEKSDPVVPTKSIHRTRENSVASIPRKPEHPRRIDRIFSVNESQMAASSDEKCEKSVAPVVPRRSRDDKSVPFNKLIEKFTKADNGAIPTPRTFQNVMASAERSKSRSNSSSSVPKAITSKNISLSGSKTISERFTERNSTNIETWRNKSSTSNNASGNSFAKVRTSFEKNVEPPAVLLESRSVEKEFISTIEENIKVEKTSSITKQHEKVEKKSAIIMKQKGRESSEVSSSSVTERISNTKVYPFVPETESSVAIIKGLDFSRFDHITDDEVIGRPLEADEAEQAALQMIKEATSSNELHKQTQPTEVEMLECRSLLGEKFADYNIFKVILKRPASNLEGSVGVILSSAASGDQYISVQRVISGSIADRSDLIEKGDRVFYVQDHSTKQMSATDARTLIKQRTERVVFVLGRLKTKSNDMSTEPNKFASTATADPDQFNYSTDSEEVILTKGNLGVGLALDGGRGSVFGDRPIIIKRIFEGGSAARSGRVKVGDQVIAIDGIDVKGMSYLEATKTLRSRPEGPLKLIILRRL
ncbi:unnamed protein product [Litomosoides sigmodontis]|uniref:PDZ domain-containing protein n=1 Tax=Litomosoides sigmodontis TaxID=42156 RepID=A0A3P6SR01_LITSI|nr:unnamed protein product [Litomosoides sigmodontis]